MDEGHRENKAFLTQQDHYMHELKEMLAACTGPARVYTRWSSKAGKRSGHMTPFLTHKSSLIHNYLQMKKIAICKVVSLEKNKLQLSIKPTPNNRQSMEDKFNGFFGSSLSHNLSWYF